LEPYEAAYIDWTSVVSGALVGTAIIATLAAFGSALGLSVTSPYIGRGFSAAAIAVGIALWTAWIIISGNLAAGYIAGRMRHLATDVTVEEAEFRDGSHGLIAWAITTILVSLMTFFIISAPHKATPGTGYSLDDHARYVGDQLIRGDRAEPPYPEETHKEVASLLQTAETRPLSTDDRAFLIRLVVAHGSAQPQAEARVDSAIADVKDTANEARKLGVLAGFLVAAALAIGAAAAWWAATVGGVQRRDYRGISIFTRWR
jgi:hypothetical protein